VMICSTTMYALGMLSSRMAGAMLQKSEKLG
jgi:hypothetical protein